MVSNPAIISIHDSDARYKYILVVEGNIQANFRSAFSFMLLLFNMDIK